MTHYYAACDFGVDNGRVMVGTLHKDRLTMSEIRRFPNQPLREKGSLHWNIAGLYQETLAALTELGEYDEPLDSISCNSWAADYLLFDGNGTLITPTFHHFDARGEAAMQKVFSTVPWETVYEETGVQPMRTSSLVQLGVEKSRRLQRASHLMPVADGFNYLLSGVPRVEMSLASTTQLYNPVTQTWSDRLLDSLHLPPRLFPSVVPAGTNLGRLRPEIARVTGLEDARVVTSCSHETAAALAGLSFNHGENAAYLRLGASAVMGTELIRPIINDLSREWNFTNEPGYGGAVYFSKELAGLWILDECLRNWAEHDRELDPKLLIHLATSSPPFESLINPADPRFQTPGDMPLKIQSFCRQTNQPIPRKPGPIARCVLESLALLYCKTLTEIEHLTGREATRLYVLGGSANRLLNRFTTNALQIPVVLVPEEAAPIGNVMVQALALGHIKTLDAAREIVSDSFKMETLVPRTTVWKAAYGRFLKLLPS